MGINLDSRDRSYMDYLRHSADGVSFSTQNESVVRRDNSRLSLSSVYDTDTGKRLVRQDPLTTGNCIQHHARERDKS